MQLFVAAGAKQLQIFGPGQSRNLYPAPRRLGTHYSIAPITGLQPGTPEVVFVCPLAFCCNTLLLSKSLESHVLRQCLGRPGMPSHSCKQQQLLPAFKHALVLLYNITQASVRGLLPQRHNDRI